jgi:hypothetical protein
MYSLPSLTNAAGRMKLFGVREGRGVRRSARYRSPSCSQQAEEPLAGPLAVGVQETANKKGSFRYTPFPCTSYAVLPGFLRRRAFLAVWARPPLTFPCPCSGSPAKLSVRLPACLPARPALACPPGACLAVPVRLPARTLASPPPARLLARSLACLPACPSACPPACPPARSLASPLACPPGSAPRQRLPAHWRVQLHVQQLGPKMPRSIAKFSVRFGTGADTERCIGCSRILGCLGSPSLGCLGLPSLGVPPLTFPCPCSSSRCPPAFPPSRSLARQLARRPPARPLRPARRLPNIARPLAPSLACPPAACLPACLPARLPARPRSLASPLACPPGSAPRQRLPAHWRV